MVREDQSASEPPLPADRDGQLALAAQLFDAKRGGLLTRADLQVIAGKTGMQVNRVMDENDENVDEDPKLARYKADYEKWDPNMKAKCAWGEVSERLLANNSHFLGLAEAMHEDGILLGRCTRKSTCG